MRALSEGRLPAPASWEQSPESLLTITTHCKFQKVSEHQWYFPLHLPLSKLTDPGDTPGNSGHIQKPTPTRLHGSQRHKWPQGWGCLESPDPSTLCILPGGLLLP